MLRRKSVGSALCIVTVELGLQASLLGKRRDHIDHRSLDAHEPRDFLDRGDERVELQRSFPIQILEHGHLVSGHLAGGGEPSRNQCPAE